MVLDRAGALAKTGPKSREMVARSRQFSQLLAVLFDIRWLLRYVSFPEFRRVKN